MTLQEFCNYINLPYAIVLNGGQFIPEKTSENALCEIFNEDIDFFFELIEKTPHREELILYLFAKWGAKCHDKYKQLNIDDDIFKDTFSDLTIWYNKCKSHSGIDGISEYRWVYHAIKMEIFRLGSLQFQPALLSTDIPSMCLERGTNILEVHIPEGSNLSPGKVKDSFEQSKSFFPNVFNKKYNIYHCESWLLSPRIPEILPKDSNIVRFNKLFDIYSEDFSLRQAEERVFGEIKSNISEYPENTLLQKNLKTYLFLDFPIKVYLSLMHSIHLQVYMLLQFSQYYMFSRILRHKNP